MKISGISLFNQTISEFQLYTKAHDTSIGDRVKSHTNSYNALLSKLEVLWSMSKGFSVIDMENDDYLMKFNDDNDTVEALTK